MIKYDIVQVLVAPEEFYPGNFDTPERANAFYSCICQDAAMEITTLQQDAARYRWLCRNMYVDDGILCIMPDIYCHKAPNKADIDTAIDNVVGVY
jgi:hypothetical protein